MKPLLSVIILAAGASSRFGKNRAEFISKLLLPLNGKPVLAHSVSAFGKIQGVFEMVIAAHPRLIPILKNQLLNGAKFPFPVKIVRGGKTRAESVLKALLKTSRKTSHVLIHDGARPLIHPDWIRKLIREANGSDGAVLGRFAVPTVKRLDASGAVLETLERSALFEAETPQIFKKEILIQAYRELGKDALFATDDASLVEQIGGVVKAVPHEGNNLKITTEEDLRFARHIMSKSDFETRLGLGFDRHRLVSGRPFYLGGVKLQSTFGPLGHSDGDPLLHAVIDGMLGALGLGDIGDFFPDTSKRYKNISSSILAKRTLNLISQKGFSVFQIDATVFLERPKLGPSKKKIQRNLAKIFGLPEDRIGVKAKTAEGLGAEGAGEAVSAQALVVLKPKEVL